MKQVGGLARLIGALAVCSFLVARCGGGSSSMGTSGVMTPAPMPSATIQSFTSTSSSVHVGESTQLTAVFVGDAASIVVSGLKATSMTDILSADERVDPRPRRQRPPWPYDGA